MTYATESATKRAKNTPRRRALIAQLLFQLDQLSATNSHHEFEHICRHLARETITPNILPATGPVTAGGDEGRDFETFTTFIRRVGTLGFRSAPGGIRAVSHTSASDGLQ